MSRKKLFFNKRSKLTFVEAMVLTCGCMLVGVPLLGSGFGDGNSYYEVTLEGKVVGSVRNPGVVENAFLEARARISRETEGERWWQWWSPEDFFRKEGAVFSVPDFRFWI